MSGGDGEFQDALGPGPAIARVNIKCPPFQKVNPQLWFVQIEAPFANAGITADNTRFNSIVATIESDVLAEISDVVLDPPAVNKYECVKNKLIERFSDSDDKKVNILLNECNLGDCKPSSLYRQMKQLAGNKVSVEFLKGIWLKKLPSHVQAVLVAKNEDMDSLIKSADKILEIPDMYVNTISSNAEPTSLSSYKKKSSLCKSKSKTLLNAIVLSLVTELALVILIKRKIFVVVLLLRLK